MCLCPRRRRETTAAAFPRRGNGGEINFTRRLVLWKSFDRTLNGYQLHPRVPQFLAKLAPGKALASPLHSPSTPAPTPTRARKCIYSARPNDTPRHQKHRFTQPGQDSIRRCRHPAPTVTGNGTPPPEQQ